MKALNCLSVIQKLRSCEIPPINILICKYTTSGKKSKWLRIKFIQNYVNGYLAKGVKSIQLSMYKHRQVAKRACPKVPCPKAPFASASTAFYADVSIDMYTEAPIVLPKCEGSTALPHFHSDF